MHRLLVLAAITFASTAASLAWAENWNMWRGPRGDGTSDEHGVPTTWSATENIAWKVPIAGEGHASPIVHGDRVFVVSCVVEKKQRVLTCLERARGKVLWQQVVLEAQVENRHQLNTAASSTPATDGERVYVAFLEPDGSDVLFKPGRFINPGQVVVAAYDMNGKLLWQVRPGYFSSIHGFCSPPVLYENLVIVNGDHDGDSYLVALDRATGKTVWKVPRENKTRSYSTPIIRQLAGRTQMVLAGNMCVASYDPRTGSRHWVLPGPTEQFVASIVESQGLLFVTGGYPDHHMLAIRPTGEGTVGDDQIAWRTSDSCSYVPSPIAVGGYFVVVSDGGIASCFEAQSGKRAWRQRLGPGYSASLVAAEGLVYFLANDGVTKVVRIGEEFDLVAENALGEDCSASPAISQGQLFIRGKQSLFCIGAR